MNKFYQLLFLIILAFFLFSCNHENIYNNYSLINGKFTDFQFENQNIGNSRIITLTVTNPVINHPIEYETKLKTDGTFSFSIPLICPVYANISSSIFNGMILLLPNKETNFEIFSDDSDRKQLNMIQGKQLTKEDLTILNESSMDIFKISDNKTDIIKDSDNYNTQPEIYRDYIIEQMNKSLNIINSNTKLNEKLKQSLLCNIKLFYLECFFFEYERSMRLRYFNINKKNGIDINENNFTPKKPKKSYYSFLKYCDLNHPALYSTEFYSKSLQLILSCEALNIPEIGDIQVNNWLKDVKSTLAELVGFDDGIFYDLLAANAYSKQINEKLQPLSDNQKENIKNYFNNNAIVDILFGENEKIIDIDLLKLDKKPEVPEEKLLDAIVARHKGKVVVVDFWATWCGPCLEAMRRFKDIKNELINKNVVFIYIAETSSPVNSWKRKVQEIPGIHYYLSQNEWKSVFQHLGLISTPTPTYLFYEKDGKLKEKIEGFPGTEKMQKMIEELLP